MRLSAIALIFGLSVSAAACSSGLKGSEFEVAADAGDAPAADEPGSLTSGPTPPADVCVGQTKNNAACEKCCERDFPGYKVFTDAIDRCACQPSQCGGVCITDICADPPQRPPQGSPCDVCIGLVLARQPTPSEYKGGASPDLGASDCRVYGGQACRASADCQFTEACKASCGRAYPKTP